MISALLCINQKGEIIVSRAYRDDVDKHLVDAYRMQVIAAKEVKSPVKKLGGCSFLHIQQGNMFFVALTRFNINAMCVFQMLHTFTNILKSYFSSCDEDAIRNNFVLVYELLDETMDYGYPQITGVELLKQYITQKGVKSELAAKSDVTMQATGTTSWRREGIKYRKNEVFLDVIEYVNLLMSPKGTPLKTDVTGQITMKSYLSGMPECKFGMNDRVVMDREVRGTAPPVTAGNSKKPPGSGIELDDCTFHQCVRLGKFDSDRTVSFVPPDGEFDLMKYRCTENIHLPFRVMPLVRELGRTRLECNVKVKALFSSKLFATGVVVKIPCPKNTALCNVSVSSGRAKYAPPENAILWKIRKFPGDMEATLGADVQLIATTGEAKPWSRPPVSMEFNVPMFTASGLHVRYLKVFEKANYNTIKWVRYITRAGSYQMRI